MSVTVSTGISSVTYPAMWGIDATPSPSNTLRFSIPEIYYEENKINSTWNITMTFAVQSKDVGDPYSVEYTLRYYYK